MRPVLSHAVVQTEGASPRRSALLVHGILGSGANLKGFARRLADAFPDWRIVLPDLRGHGDSPAGAGPHSLEACAEDLIQLTGHLGLEPELCCGHSFGGKVTLCYAARRPAGLTRAWVLDAPPGRRERAKSDPMEQSAADVILALRQVLVPIKSRKSLIDQLLGLGLSRPIALWMTTNLKDGPGGFVWRFELSAVQEMLASYLETDLWGVLEEAPCRIDLLRAERSFGWQPADLERLAALEPAGRVRVHLLPDSGHWVHVDNPDGLFAMLADSFETR